MENETKEKILWTALDLFSQNGYEAVSVSDIAGALSLTKAALYKHYRSKRDIFEMILARMESEDFLSAQEYSLPQTTKARDPNSYSRARLESVISFAESQFRYWTKNPFASRFRRMLTVEQYRNPEMTALYQQYFCTGPFIYIKDIFSLILPDGSKAEQKAVELCSPMHMLYGMYDGTADKSAPGILLKEYMENFEKQFEGEEMKNSEFVIRNERPSDYAETEKLVRESFWNVYRPGCLEHYVLNCFRSDKDFVPELDFVMEKDGVIIGQVMYARALIKADDGRNIPVMTFGPICIAPEYKRRGYGKKLLDYSLKEAEKLGAGAVAITGNILFYGKSGFTVASGKGVRYAEASPEDRTVPYFLIKELTRGYLDGVSGTFKEPDGYFVCEKNPAEFEKYESQFPKKEKLKLPGQLV